MGSKYTPDTWIVLEFDYAGQVTRKVFAGWYGGYARGDSWKLSSGITNTREFDDRFEFENHSGSLYTCFKTCERMSGYQMQLLNGWSKEVEESENVTMKVIEYVKADLPE